MTSTRVLLVVVEEALSSSAKERRLAYLLRSEEGSRKIICSIFSSCETVSLVSRRSLIQHGLTPIHNWCYLFIEESIDQTTPSPLSFCPQGPLPALSRQKGRKLNS